MGKHKHNPWLQTWEHNPWLQTWETKKHNMLSLSYTTHKLPFIYPFRTAHGLKTEQPTLIIKLGFKGIYGFGEATEIVYYGVTLDAMIEQLEAKRRVIENYSLIDPERFWHFLHHLFPNQHFLNLRFRYGWLGFICKNAW